MSLGQRHWTTRLISQVLCCTIFLQTGMLAAGTLPAPPERQEWVSAESLAALVKADLPMEPMAVTEPSATDPEPVRIAALQEKPASPPGVSPRSILTDAADESEVPAARPEPVEEREEPPAPVEIRPEDLPPFPPGMDGAVLSRASAAAAAGTLQALTASSLIASWNLASVQNVPVDKSPASVFSSIAGKYTRVFAYNACTPADPWKVYDPADAAGSDLAQVDQKIGFWIEMTAPAAVPNPGSLANETTIHLCVGWNLIGFPAGQARPVRTALSSIEGKYARVFGFDPADAADPWELYDVAVPSWANDLDLMQPGRGYWVLATAETDLKISNVGAEPEVAITAPADLGVVTAPTDVIGTVRSDRLQSWTLSYRPHGEAQETVFATGNTPVVNGRIATFDPTLLLNGGYTVELTATDFNGQSSTAEVDVSVEGTMKIGTFTLSFVDVEIPLSGLPIEVVRNYDSRDKRRGDFGVGWTLELRQGSYRNNRKPGEGWQLTSGFLPCQNIVETKPHLTTVRISDREVYRFRLRLASPAPTLGGCFGQARFDFVDGPVPGATLAILGNTGVLYQNGTDHVIDLNGLEVYEPQDVRLTTRDGRIFDLDLQQGVHRVQDRNGNTVSITPSGIAHSGGVSVAFVRDGQGRITSITDAAGENLVYTYDAAGDLASVTDQEDNTTTFSYDSNHGLLAIQDPLGRQPVRNEYDAAGRLLRTIDASGREIEFEHQIGDRREVLTDRLGFVRVFEYDARGNVVREVDTEGKAKLRTFGADDQLLSETDPLGNTTSYAYDANQNLTELRDPLGKVTRFTYNSRGELLTTTDPSGRVTTNAYSATGNLLSITDPLGNATNYAYDARGNLLSETDPEGIRKEYDYDGAGRLVSETDAAGQTTAYTFDASGNRLTETTTRTTSQGTETLTRSFTYDRLGRLTRSVDPDGSAIETIYDAADRVVATIDKKGRQTTFLHDDLGRLIQTTHPDGTTEKTTYDSEGKPVSRTDRAGRTTTYTYDGMGRVLTAVHPGGATVTNAYDSAGRLVETRDARNNATRYEYDAAGRRTKIIDALGHATTFVYDNAGRQIAVTDPRGKTTQFEYDEAGRRVRTVFADGTFAATTYDRTGRRTSETDPAGKTTSFGHDGAGRLVSVTDALGQITRYTYDEQGNRISQVDANGHETRFEYDPLGRMTKRILPDGAADTFAYDLAGNLIRRTDVKGSVTNYTYDLNDRLLSRSYPNGSSVGFSYTASGQRETATDARGVTAYDYDARDRLAGVTYPDGRRLSFTYDAQGNRTSTSAVLGATTLTTSYTYDLLNRLEGVVDPLGQAFSYAYDPNGNRESLAYPNGVATSYGYDDLNRLLTLTSSHTVTGVIQSYSYTLGPAGNRTRVDEQDGAAREYTYDALYRLTQETVNRAGSPVYQNVFNYDPAGNRLRQDRSSAAGATSLAYTYDDRDRLLSEGATTYAWDANGNQTGKSGADGATYTWDFENRLIEVVLANGTVVEHAYDADGNRVRTEITPANGPPQVTEYLVDPQHMLASAGTAQLLSQVVCETDAAGSLKNYYVRGDELLAVLRPVPGSPGSYVARYFHADGLGSIRALTDEAGAVTDRYEFEAFGSLLAHQGSDPNAYLFAGEQLDPNSGFYYLRARWMDPAVGRFASVDPFAGLASDPITLHRYLYAAASPLNLTDPSGEFSGGLSGMMASMAIGGMINAVFTGIFSNHSPDTGAFWADVGQGFAIGALTAPVGGLFARVLAPFARLTVRPLLSVIGRMGRIVLTGKGPIGRMLVKMSRYFVNTNLHHPSVSSTFLGRTMQRLFPGVKWEMHHVYIQQSWSRVGSEFQLYDDLAANEGLRRIGNGLWNLLPIPKSLNNALGTTTFGKQIGTQLLATAYYSILVYGPVHTLLSLLGDDE